MMKKTLVIKNNNKNNLEEHLIGTINELGDINLEGQDLGRNIFGEFSEYEYFYTIKAKDIPKLLEKLGDELDPLIAIKNYFNKNTSFKKFLDDNNIEYKFYNHIGD